MREVWSSTGGCAGRARLHLASSAGILLQLCEVQSVASIEQKWTKHGTHLSVSPMLAENVRRVGIPTNVVERDHLGGDCLARVVVGQCVMTLGEGGVGDGSPLHH